MGGRRGISGGPGGGLSHVTYGILLWLGCVRSLFIVIEIIGPVDVLSERGESIRRYESAKDREYISRISVLHTAVSEKSDKMRKWEYSYSLTVYLGGSTESCERGH